MRTSKKIVSLVLAVMMVASMMVVGTVSSVSAATVAKIGGTGYATLEAAFAAAVDGDTITLQADCAGNGIVAQQGKFKPDGLTVDFNGKTYTVDGNTVGSTGTETNAFQLLKDNKITFKNGTITSTKAKILVQNYSDLTLDNMTLTLDNPKYAYAYTLSNNNGNVVIDDTTINANPAGGYAFDVCRYSSYPSVNVTVTGDSSINGNVEVSASNGNAGDGFSLNLESGKMTGNVVVDSSATTAMNATPEKATIAQDTTEFTMVADPAAQIGSTKYETLEEAFAAAQDGATIELLKSSAGNGIIAPQGKFQPNGLTVDFAGYTYTVDGETVGSTGTETNGFQLLKDNKITFKDGTITSTKAKILVQNYSNLTLDNMTLTLNNPNYHYAYTLSNNNGNVTIDGTTINANPAGGFAFDVCRYASYPSVNVTVTDSSVINGDVEVSASGSDAKDGFSLTLTSGTISGDIVLDATAEAAMAATPDKAEVTKATTFAQDAPAGYVWKNGTTLIAVGAEIDGYQRKVDNGSTESTEATGNDITTRGVRIITKVDRDWLDANADDYGYIVGKVTDSQTKTFDQPNTNFTSFTAANGAKKISCKTSTNEGLGLDEDSITLAINGMDSGDKAVARFYVEINGVTYYANYSTYTGILAAY